MINHLLHTFERLSIDDIKLMHQQALGAKALAEQKGMQATSKLWAEIIEKIELVLEAKREQ